MTEIAVPLPRSVVPKTKWVIIWLHVLAAALAVPFFSWAGVAACLLLWLITGLGVTVGYHRFLTHGSFRTYRPVRWVLAVMGTLSGEGAPISWVAMHRRHHQFSDEKGDPHSPKLDGISFAHIRWLWAYNLKKQPEFFQAYAPDLLAEPFMRFLSRSYAYWHIALAALLLGCGYLWNGWYGAASFLVYGVLLRLLLVLHVTWSVNSACHRWGYRNYTTADDSRNLWWVGLLAFGEGWHNNHHYRQTLAQHGHHWWEIDVSYWFIWLLQILGLAWNVKKLKASQ